MKTEKDAIIIAIAALEDHQQTIFEQGHSFWHCDASDTNDKGEYKPFRYYQTNRTKHMSTCGNCYKLMELRKQIRALQRAIGVPLTPLFTNHTETKAIRQISVKGCATIFNVNASYAGWQA